LAGSPIVLIGAEGDRPVIDAMRRELQDVGGSDLIGCHDLMAVAAVLRRSAVTVVNDSGLAHLSAAAGCPTVTLFGPTRPDLYRPWGDQVVAVQAPESESGRNMAGLSLDTVENAVVELLA
jgi:heptosyltransferase-3